jgi:hypothetical protein
LVDCPSCGAQVLLDLDGPPVVSPVLEASMSGLSVPQNGDGAASDFQETQAHFGGDANDLSLFDSVDDEARTELVSKDSLANNLVESKLNEHEPDADKSDVLEPLAINVSELRFPSKSPSLQTNRPSTTPDMSDIAEFGNSTVSQGREGILRFNLYITGIDTADLRNEIRDALRDDRFLWDTENIISKIKNGELVLNEITPVKSAILLQRLRSISVDIRWEQYAVHQV